MKNYVQPGKTITLAAPYAVSAGDGLLVGAIFGVATASATIPMFILVRQVQMPRLLDWRGPAESWVNRLPDQVVREWEARDRASRDAQ